MSLIITRLGRNQDTTITVAEIGGAGLLELRIITPGEGYAEHTAMAVFDGTEDFEVAHQLGQHLMRWGNRMRVANWKATH